MRVIKSDLKVEFELIDIVLESLQLPEEDGIMNRVPFSSVDDGVVWVVGFHCEASNVVDVNCRQSLLLYEFLKLLDVASNSELDNVLDIRKLTINHVFLKEFHFFVSILNGFLYTFFDDRLVLW